MVKSDLLTKKQEEYFEKYLIWEFFDFSCEGIFVDVGAFHSKEFSQTWLLEKVGWKGILIEPLPENADELRKHRPLSKVYQTAISCREKAGVAAFYVNSGYSALVPHITDNRRKYINQITVSVTTLDEVLEKEGNPKIDFLSIDVEGGELDCLKGLNLEQNHPRLILTEDGVLSLDLHNYLLSKGYRLLRRTQENIWYVPKSCVRYPSLLEKLKLFRKMYLGTPLRAWKFKREKARLKKMKRIA